MQPWVSYLHREDPPLNHIDFDDFASFLRTIRLHNPRGNFYAEGRRKYEQLLAYLPQIESATAKLSTKRQLVMLDAGCGRGYLSLLVYAYFTKVVGRQIRIIGIDRNPKLIKQCRIAAKELGFDQLEFYATDISMFKLDEPVDIIYSLHACDDATDQTIAKGIELKARYILSVSCCQHTNRTSMRRHPMTSVSRHSVFRERLADMVGDSMRALILEQRGYGVKVFEFATSGCTPKNVMLKAVRDTARKVDIDASVAHYERLAEAFHFRPRLQTLIEEL